MSATVIYADFRGKTWTTDPAKAVTVALASLEAEISGQLIGSLWFNDAGSVGVNSYLLSDYDPRRPD